MRGRDSQRRHEGKPTALETLEVETISGQEVVLAEVLRNMAGTGGGLGSGALLGVVGVIRRRNADISLVLGHCEAVANGSRFREETEKGGINSCALALVVTGALVDDRGCYSARCYKSMRGRRDERGEGEVRDDRRGRPFIKESRQALTGGAEPATGATCAGARCRQGRGPDARTDQATPNIGK